MCERKLTLPGIPPLVSLTDEAQKNRFCLKKSNSYDLSQNFHRIKQSRTEQLPELRLIFDNYDEAKSFNCTYKIIANNLPRIIGGELHFIIQK